MQFIGRYYHALEQKGRLSIPAPYRQLLGESVVVTRGLDGCLYLFPIEKWQSIVSDSSTLPFTQKSVREWVRLLAHNAVEVNFDKIGRILLPDYLIKSASLQKRVVVAGSIGHIEIWDQNLYHTHLEDLETRAEEIAQAVSINQPDNKS